MTRHSYNFSFAFTAGCLPAPLLSTRMEEEKSLLTIDYAVRHLLYASIAVCDVFLL